MKKKIVTLSLVLLLVLATALTGCGGGGGGGGDASSDGPAPADVITWKVQGSGGAGTQYDRLYTRLCENIELLSGGRLVMDYYPVGTIAAFGEMPNAVDNGTLDAVLAYTGMWSSLEYAMPLFCSTPGWFHDARDLYMWLEYGGGGDLLNKGLEKYNTHAIAISLLDMEVFQWSNKKLQTLDDLKAAKMRMMPIMGDVLQSHGFPVTFLAANELFASLERGVVDGIEYGNPALDITEGYQDIAKYYHYPGVHQPSATQHLFINTKKWDALPDDLKEIVQIACRESMLYNWGDSGINTVKALDEFEKNGNELVILDDEAVKTMQQWANDYFIEASASDPYLKEVRDSQIEFGKEWFAYKEFIDMPYPDLK